MSLSLEEAKYRARGTLVELLGIEFEVIETGYVRSLMQVRADHLAPNDFLHAASVVALADTTCGYGALASLPEGADSFTTLELKANFLGTARSGQLTCEGRMLHGGRRTQVWDASVSGPRDREIAVFRCTQMLLYPSAKT